MTTLTTTMLCLALVAALLAAATAVGLRARRSRPLGGASGTSAPAVHPDLTTRLFAGTRRQAILVDDGAAIDTHLRGAALVAMGRYSEAASVLGDDPQEPLIRHQRAQIAVETGDDATALRLLEDAHDEAVDEAGRQRILGDLHIRRGRLHEGESLVREARATYLVSRMARREIDTAHCHHHLGEAALARRDAPGALAQLTTALALLSVRPDNAAGFAMVHSRLAEAHALVGDAELADSHVREAVERCEQVGSPSLTTTVQRSRGLVALHLGRCEEARSHLASAWARHLALGELPAATSVRELLASLDITR